MSVGCIIIMCKVPWIPWTFFLLCLWIKLSWVQQKVSELSIQTKAVFWVFCRTMIYECRTVDLVIELRPPQHYGGLHVYSSVIERYDSFTHLLVGLLIFFAGTCTFCAFLLFCLLFTGLNMPTNIAVTWEDHWSGRHRRWLALSYSPHLWWLSSAGSCSQLVRDQHDESTIALPNFTYDDSTLLKMPPESWHMSEELGWSFELSPSDTTFSWSSIIEHFT